MGEIQREARTALWQQSKLLRDIDVASWPYSPTLAEFLDLGIGSRSRPFDSAGEKFQVSLLGGSSFPSLLILGGIGSKRVDTNQ